MQEQQLLSALNRLVDAENLVNVALEQTGRWEQGELLQIKAKVQIAQGQFKNGLETYTHLLAVLQVKKKSFNAENSVTKVSSWFICSQMKLYSCSLV